MSSTGGSKHFSVHCSKLPECGLWKTVLLVSKNYVIWWSQWLLILFAILPLHPLHCDTLPKRNTSQNGGSRHVHILTPFSLLGTLLTLQP